MLNQQANHTQRPGWLQITFIATLVYNLLAFIAWFFYSYLLPTRCVIEPLCGFDQLGWFPQMALILASMVAVGLLVVGGIRLVTQGDASGRLAQTINSWAPSAEAWRPLLVVAIILSALLFVTLVSGHATLPLALLGCGDSALLFVAARAGRRAAQRAPKPATPLPQQARPTAAPTPATAAGAASDATTGATVPQSVAATSANARPPAFSPAR
jgi:hypothetical protein